MTSRLQIPSSSSDDRGKVIAIEKLNKRTARATIPNSTKIETYPLYPPDRSSLLPEEANELTLNDGIAFYLRLVCSPLSGTLWPPDSGVAPATFFSDFATLCNSVEREYVLPLRWVEVYFGPVDGRPHRVYGVRSGTSGSPDSTPTENDGDFPGAQSASLLLEAKDYITGVDLVFGAVLCGLVLYTNLGKEVLLGTLADTHVDSELSTTSFKPPDNSYGLCGWRWWKYSGDFLDDEWGAPSIIKRIGLVWTAMDTTGGADDGLISQISPTDSSPG